MRFPEIVKRRMRLTPGNLLLLFLLALILASCAHTANRKIEPEVTHNPPGWTKGALRFRAKELAVVQVAYPSIQDAEFVHDDELCMTCHETYVKSFAHNVHRKQHCEDCHGPASKHLATRGKEPGMLFNFKTMHPAERAEVCLKCHEQDACTPGATWRISVHAHKGVTCNDCHRGHYNVPPGTPPTTAPGGDTQASVDVSFDSFASVAPEKSTAGTTRLAALSVQDNAAAAADTRPSLRGTSHFMGAVTPDVCYRCHQEKHELQAVASPHQIGGPNGFNCNTCHDPHGKILESSRKDLCLKCHTGSPSAAWHSSSHDRAGVGCTDCHNPHPGSRLHTIADINHTNIRRPSRMPMAVMEPDACYKCHAKIMAMAGMPSHHPIKEGKMVCSDCHDPHGQALDNLKEPTVNMVCYRCHMDKQGPFVWEHPPVTENCTICHNPHGTVANNLLHQPTTFLCLRCHTGHRMDPNFGPHAGAGVVDLGTSVKSQRAFYSDCTQCHSQIHGSDKPSPHEPSVFLR